MATFPGAIPFIVDMGPRLTALLWARSASASFGSLVGKLSEPDSQQEPHKKSQGAAEPLHSLTGRTGAQNLRSRRQSNCGFVVRKSEPYEGLDDCRRHRLHSRVVEELDLLSLLPSLASKARAREVQGSA